MALSFPLKALLQLRDDLSRPATRVFDHVVDLGDRAAGAIRKRFSKVFTKDNILGGLKSVATTVTGAAAAGLGAAAYGLEQVSESMAKTAEAAEAQGVDATLLGALRSEGARKGIENLDEINRATEEFFLRLTELRQKAPTGELYSNLKDVGATALIKQFRAAKDETEALKLALLALATETDERNRIRLADSIFGGSDQALDLRRIATSKQAVRELFEQQAELAGATEEQFEAAKQYQQAQRELGQTFGRVARTLAGSLAPALTEAVKKIQSWIDANRALIDQKIAEFVELVQRAIARLMEVDWAAWFAKAYEIGVAVTEVLGQLGRAVVRVGEFLGELGVGVDELVLAAEAFFAMWAVGKVAGVVGSIQKITGAVGGLAGRFGAVSASAAGMAGAVAATALASWEIGTALDQALGLSDKLSDAMMGGQRVVGEQAPGQLSEEALAFGKGEVEAKQRRYFESTGLGSARTVEEAAARQIVRNAEGAGLIKNGVVDVDEATLRFQRAGQSYAQARTSVEGLQRAHSVQTESRQANMVMLPTGQLIDLEQSRQQARAAEAQQRAARQMERSAQASEALLRRIQEYADQARTAAARGAR